MPGARAADDAFIDRALFLAERGRGRTSPNPLVGAVVVSPDGIVVGQGAHLEAGGPHAEAVALEAAGARARGATLYCTLEPCCHVGRTGPCVERIVEAGVARVVAAATDPNPRVAGGGFRHLRAHGIPVDEDVRPDAVARQNAPFFTWILERRPLVVVKAAVSADGFVARLGERIRLTGPAADRWFQRQRSEVDAIAVGSETVLVDDPLLTARGAYRFRPLTRVVFDWRGRVPPGARVLSTVSAGPVIIVLSRRLLEDRPEHVAALRGRGADIEALDEHDVRAAVARLGDRGILSLLVEGGSTLHTAVMDAGLADRVQIAFTPRVLRDGLPVSQALAGALERAAAPRTTALGGDVLVEFEIRDVHRTDRIHGTH